jgi:hypothetical protein
VIDIEPFCGDGGFDMSVWPEKSSVATLTAATITRLIDLAEQRQSD